MKKVIRRLGRKYGIKIKKFHHTIEIINGVKSLSVYYPDGSFMLYSTLDEPIPYPIEFLNWLTRIIKMLFIRNCILSDEQLKILLSITNRSVKQNQMLFQLLNGNFKRLEKLEKQIKKHFIFWVPTTKKEVKKIMSLK